MSSLYSYSRSLLPRECSGSVLLFLLALASCSGADEGSQSGDCRDGADNDVDGLFDCDDDGCAGSPDCEEVDVDTDADSDADADVDITISSVEPPFGSTAGGREVVIGATPLDSSAVVKFGSQTADIQSLSFDEVVVTTPSMAVEGPVDVTVTIDDGSGTAVNAFTYYQDGTGLAGAIGLFTWYQFLGDYWKDPEDYGRAWMTFIEPVDFYIWDWYAPAVDTCYNGDYEGAADVIPIDTGATRVTLTSGSVSVRLDWDDTENRFSPSSDLSSSSYVQNADYDLEELSSATFANFEVPGLFRTPRSFSLTSPDLSDEWPPTLSRSELTFRWSGSGGDVMLLDLFMYDLDYGYQDQKVFCVMRDDGSFSVPTSIWDGYPSDEVVYVYLHRVVMGSAPLPHNNADSRMIGSYSLIGAFLTP